MFSTFVYLKPDEYKILIPIKMPHDLDSITIEVNKVQSNNFYKTLNIQAKRAYSLKSTKNKC